MATCWWQEACPWLRLLRTVGQKASHTPATLTYLQSGLHWIIQGGALSCFWLCFAGKAELEEECFLLSRSVGGTNGNAFVSSDTGHPFSLGARVKERTCADIASSLGAGPAFSTQGQLAWRELGPGFSWGNLSILGVQGLSELPFVGPFFSRCYKPDL